MQLLQRLSFTMLLMSMMTLVACGDGDGNLTGGDDGSITPDTLTLTVAKSDGDLSAANDVTVTATVLEGGSPVVNKTVTFALDVEGSATLDPISGTATTKADGTATIDIKVTDVKGSVNVIATYEDATDNISFDSAGDGITVVDGEPTPATIKLYASSQQLASSSAEMIILTAIAKDANNHLLQGVTINFSVDSGTIGGVENAEGEISNVTDINGKVQKGLITSTNPKNRIITVNVSSTNGDITDSLEVEVVGTTITLTGTSSLALEDEATYIVKVLDSDGKAIPRTVVTVSATNPDSIIIPSTVETDSTGQVKLNVTGTTGGKNTITVTALGASASQSVSVQADSFLFTGFVECEKNDSACAENLDPSTGEFSDSDSEILLSKKVKVTLTWLRSGQPVADGTVVNFTSTRGNLTTDSATTVAGKVTAILTSSNAGKALLTFTGEDFANDEEIELSNQLEFEFVADTAHRIIAQAFPVSIGPNGQTSTVSVVVRDPEGNLVKNKKVKFELDDVSGGEIFSATAITDSNGNASTVYTSKNTSAHEGVHIITTVVDTPAVSDAIDLTVADREVFIRLGTGNTILQHDDNTYNKQYSVFVTDIDSNPVPNVTLTVSAIPKEYFKGTWIKYLDEEGEFVQWGPGDTTVNPEVRGYSETCANEDINKNGVLDDIATPIREEDTNTDGMLTPGNIVTALGLVTTDEYGIALIDIRYAEVYGYWANIELIVSAKVEGTESFAKTVFNLDVLSSDVTDEDITPAAFIWPSGPFGQSDSCFNPD
ncbi:MAG: hypothetical protein GY928_36860 [Colwellia sp.]|nr:hypothetical protein [Colwellia sp.]